MVDRLKDMIITGGENVYSVEVERVLSRHPDVESAAVIGLPDPDWGERVHAVIRPRPGAALTPAELIAHARQSLAGYKLPKSIDIRSEPLPVSAVGKVLKRALREEYTSVKSEGS
jgi:long-chain acyl-CoA synthetase